MHARRIPCPPVPALEVRPITAADAGRLAAAFERLGEDTRYLRFLAPKPRLTEAELTYLTDIDHRRHEALAAVDPQDGSFLGVARYATGPGETDSADFAFVVADDCQGRGIGTLLARALIARAAENGLTRLRATTLYENARARAVLRRLGFRTRTIAGMEVELELPLDPAATTAAEIGHLS
jgi:RimJ/RimL family protein N-acetyltransferase